MKTQILTLNPWFYTKSGHNYVYLDSLEKACKKLDWKFSALLPKKNVVENLPDHWMKCIDCPTVRHWFEYIEKSPYKRARKVIRAKQRIRYFTSLLSNVRKNLIKGHNILFLETFATTDLTLLTHLLYFLPKKNLQLWLLYRYPSFFMKEDVNVYKKCHEKIVKMGIKLKLIADSDLLVEDQSRAFNYKVHLFPIPHVEDFEIKKGEKKDTIDCWWPGLAREGKGQKIIQNFALSNSIHNSLFQIFAAKNAKLESTLNSPNIIELKDELSREEYIYHLLESDLILLPYIDLCYEKTTSGIFVEAIMAGNVPVVYPGTWMAYELKKHSLEKLIINWDQETLAEKLLEIHQDDIIKEKLSLMRSHYQKFHSIENFASEMEKLLTFELNLV